MEWLLTVWTWLQQAVNPQTIISVGGIWLLVGVVFAETGLMAGFFLPGDSLLFTAGLLCTDPKFINNSPLGLNIITVLLFVTAAAVLGDSLGYFIGRRAGPKIFNRPESLLFKPEYISTTKKFYDRHGDKALVIGRFLPIVRTFAPVMAGVVGLEYRRFVFYNITGGILWVFSLVMLGYVSGHLFPAVHDFYEYIVISFIVVTTVPIVRTIISENRLRRRAKTAEKKPEAKHVAAKAKAAV